jgi:hypothetical protein
MFIRSAASVTRQFFSLSYLYVLWKKPNLIRESFHCILLSQKTITKRKKWNRQTDDRIMNEMVCVDDVLFFTRLYSQLLRLRPVHDRTSRAFVLQMKTKVNIFFLFSKSDFYQFFLIDWHISFVFINVLLSIITLNKIKL